MNHPHAHYWMRFDANSIMYMTKRDDAELITGIIIKHLCAMNLKYDEITITDATAGIGGNTCSFAQFFLRVNSVEIDRYVFSMLSHNINYCAYMNVALYNGDYTKIFGFIKQDVIFIDPPWGGRKYKKHDSLTLKLSDMDIEELCLMLMHCAIIVAIKLPLNYDFTKMYEKLHKNNIKVSIYRLNKMYVVVLHHT